MSALRVRSALVALCLITLGVWSTAAWATDPFYKGKRLTLLINYAAGGPSDIEGRLLVRHIGKYLDGNPTIIVQNMDGAGGMIGNNYLGEIAPKDGTMVGYFTGSAWNAAASRIIREAFPTAHIPAATKAAGAPSTPRRSP